MKTFKINIIILISIIGIIMCYYSVRTQSTISPKGKNPFRKATYFKYNNHSYIRFASCLDHKGMGVVHDPDCNCHKKGDY